MRLNASVLAFTRGSAAARYSSQHSKSLLQGRRSIAARSEASWRSRALAVTLAEREILALCLYSRVGTLKEASLGSLDTMVTMSRRPGSIATKRCPG